ncbi:MAG: permease prefix domain 1-containing protein [Planctomycetota bacterium]
MTDTRQELDPITSSARDPIDRWLDVFVRLLRVPKADAQRIRDELEDHLRARVDDLMVTGQSEPEAVRLAVAELGETAELARQFQTAAKPHRRRTMLAASAIVSAGLVTSAVLLTQPAAPPPLSSGSAASQAAAAIQTPDNVPAEPVTFARGLVADDRDAATLGDLIALLEETTGQRVIVLYAGIASQGSRLDPRMTIRPFDLAGLTVEQGLDLVGTDLGARPGDTFVLNTTETALELAPQSFFDRRDAVLIEYDIRELLYPPAGSYIEPTRFATTVTSLIEPGLWETVVQGSTPRARMGVLSTTMFVNAHPRVHAQIEGLFDRIRSRYADQLAESRRAEREGMVAEIERLEEQIAASRAQLEEERARLPELETLRDELRVELHLFEESMGQADAEGAVRERIRYEALGSRLAETRSDVDRLRSSIGRIEKSIDQREANLALTSKRLEAHLVEHGG